MRSALALLGAVLAFAPAQKVTLTLDWTPNPDHIGIYDAQATGLFAKAGLDVSIHSPSDPTAPLKLVAAGDSDLAVSYEQELFFAAMRGDHLLNGFRNRDLAEQLYPRPTKDIHGQRRRTARVSRLIQLLRAHALIAKIPHSYRYRVTDKGEAIMSAAVYLRHKAFPKELNDVA